MKRTDLHSGHTIRRKEDESGKCEKTNSTENGAPLSSMPGKKSTPYTKSCATAPKNRLGHENENEQST